MPVVYETQWVARDENKEYPDGWGFSAPLAKFPSDADPVKCAEICRKELSNEEFECINAIPRKVVDFSERNLADTVYPRIFTIF